MKLLITNEKDELDEYKTISPLLGMNIFEIDSEIAADSECDEIFAPKILDFIPYNRLHLTLESYRKKLRKGGKLIIGGTDIYLLINLINRRLCTFEKISVLLYGKEIANEKKSGMYGANDISNLLASFGFIIDKKNILEHLSYQIEAVKC